MPVLLWITRATGLVPGWCWAVVVGVLVALCVRLDVGMAQARTEAATARADLLAVQLASAVAIGAETERAQARVRTLTQTAMEAQDALSEARAAAAGRTADLDGRLRQLARPLSCRPAAGATAAPAVSGDGQPDPGLRAAPAADLVVLDGTALAELADLAVGARTVGETLIHARHLLRECWRSVSQ